MNAGQNEPQDSAVRSRRLHLPEVGDDADDGDVRLASNDSRQTSKVEVPNSAELGAVKCLRCGWIANPVSLVPCAICMTVRTLPCIRFNKKGEMILELEAKLSLKRKKNLRDIGEGAPQVITNGVNVIPLFFGHGGTDVIGQHLSLVKQPLENEQRRC